MNEQQRHWTESFRIVTPILVTVAIFILGNVFSTVNKIDDKLFKHLTNDEIHTARTQIVSKAEFDLISKIREDQYKDIKNTLVALDHSIDALKESMRKR